MMESFLKRRNTIASNLGQINPRVFCYVCGKVLDSRTASILRVDGREVFVLCGRKQCEEIARKTVALRGLSR